jgi:hypothetical protein
MGKRRHHHLFESKKKDTVTRINYTSTSAAGKTACNNYTEAIRDCNRYANLGSFSTIGGGVLLTIVVYVLAIADPEGISKVGLALLAALLTALTGLTATAVASWIDYYKAYLKVAECYKKVIAYKS